MFSTMKLRAATFACATYLLLTPVSHAISINLVPVGIGNPIATTGVNATGAPAGAVGGGTLDQAFQAAAFYWESAILDNFTVTIDYGWGDTGGANTLAFEQTQTYSGPGNSGRITNAGIVVKSQAGAAWYADPTPDTNTEYGSLGTLFANAALCNGAANCAGVMTTGIVYSGAADPIIQTDTDLLSVVIHEMGHALGLDVGFANYTAAAVSPGPINAITLTGPRAFAGATIFDNGTGNAHLDPSQGNLGGSLMQATIGTGVRRLPSAADILAVCQVSNFTNCSTSASIPEPIPSELLVTSALALYFVRRRLARR
jgi:hypothetical protein